MIKIIIIMTTRREPGRRTRQASKRNEREGERERERERDLEDGHDQGRGGAVQHNLEHVPLDEPAEHAQAAACYY